MSPARALLVAISVLAAACSAGSPAADRGPSPESTTPSSGPTASGRMEEVACGLPAPWILRIARGYHPERSAELQILPREPNFVGAGLPHVGPWTYTSHVPLFWYGPGHVEPTGRIGSAATLADIAPTHASMLGLELPMPDGKELAEVLASDEPSRPPRLIVTVIWDGAGRHVLDEWRGRWPNLRRLIPEGAWYEEAFAGSSPTSSAQGHAIIGTGTFPRTHGLVGHSIRVRDRIVPPWRTGPELLLRPALADLWLEEMGRRTKVGLLGTVAIQLGMIGHGSAWEGNPKPLVVLREAPNAETLGAEGVRWNLPQSLRRFYRFPAYANDLPALGTYFPDMDRRDGEADGTWRGHALNDEVIQGGFQTPARIPYQTRLLEEVIEREGFGDDDVTDLLFVNYKLIDQLGHIFSMNSQEMGDAVEVQDEYLPVLIDILDRLVGEGEWILVITADHGSTPSPEVSGAFQISAGEVHARLQEAFDLDDDDRPVVQQVKQTEIFVDTEELAEHGSTLDEMARFVMDLRQEDTAIPDVSNVTDPSARVFQAAFPASIIPELPCLPEGPEKAEG